MESVRSSIPRLVESCIHFLFLCSDRLRYPHPFIYCIKSGLLCLIGKTFHNLAPSAFLGFSSLYTPGLLSLLFSKHHTSSAAQRPQHFAHDPHPCPVSWYPIPACLNMPALLCYSSCLNLLDFSLPPSHPSQSSTLPKAQCSLVSHLENLP